METLSDKLKRELETLSHVAHKPADQMNASEVYELYREAGGEVYTPDQIRDGLETKAVWAVNLRAELASGFQFMAGTWRIPTDADAKALEDQLLAHVKQVDLLTATGTDYRRRIDRAEALANALPRMVELKTLIEDAETQERIAASVAEGQRQ